MVSVADVINTRHARAKAENWKAAPPGKAAFIAAVLDDNNLIRRPIFLEEGRVVVGHDEQAIRSLLR